MDMDLLIELAVRAVKAYLEKEGITSVVPAERKVNSALILTEHHCEECAAEKPKPSKLSFATVLTPLPSLPVKKAKLLKQLLHLWLQRPRQKAMIPYLCSLSVL